MSGARLHRQRQLRFLTTQTPDLQRDPETSSDTAPSESSQGARSNTEELNRLLDVELDFTKRTSGRSPRFSSRRGQNSRSLNGYKPPEGNSVDDVLNAVASRKPLATDLLNPISWGLGPDSTLSPRAPPAPQRDLGFKLNPSVGRTVRINNENMDVARAFRQLDILCARNRVKRHAMRQRFHERPGLKRKRLKSERWRRRFKEGFKAVIQRVRAMKRQGW